MRIRKRMDSAILFSVKGKNKYKLLKLECLFCTLLSHSAIIAGEKKCPLLYRYISQSGKNRRR